MTDDIDFQPKPASFPCMAKKHTFEQVDCIRKRVERGEELFHPDDERDVEYDVDVLRLAYKLLKKHKDIFVAERAERDRIERAERKAAKRQAKPRKAMIAPAPKRRVTVLDTPSMQE